MAYKGTSSKSSSGASMSKYDVEVEKRLQALESKAHEECSTGGGGDCAALEEKLDKVIKVLHSLADFDL